MAISYGNFGTLDFIQYWSSFQLLLRDQNPYAYPLLENMQRSLGNSGDIVLMWNPPWLLLLLYPILALPFSQSAITWLIVNFGSILLTSVLLTNLYKPRREIFPLALIVLLAFGPLWFSLLYGQVTALLTLFFCVSIFLLQRGAHFWSGVVFSLLTIKPHIFICIFVALMAWTFLNRGTRFLIGVLCGVVCLIGTTYLYKSTLPLDWISSFSVRAQVPGGSLDSIWLTSTLIGFLRSIFDITGETLGILILGIGALGSLVWAKTKRDWPVEYMILPILPVSLLFAPYGWFFDYLILLPLPFAALAGFTKLTIKPILFSFLLVACSILAQPVFFPRFERLIWFPVIVFLCCWSYINSKRTA